jgi:hypothetical protein
MFITIKTPVHELRVRILKNEMIQEIDENDYAFLYTQHRS